MADVVLSNGQEITFDLNSFSVDEYEKLFDKDQTDEVRNIIIAKAAGLSVKEFRKRYGDWRLIIDGFYKKLRTPLADPNSPSAST